MADIRIIELPEENSPSPNEYAAIDGATTRKTKIQTLVEAGRPTASEAEAIAGTDPQKAMTPLTTKQAIDAQITEIAASPASIVPIPMTFDGVTKSFNLGVPLISTGNVTIFHSGLGQYATNYSVLGNVVTFIDAPPPGTGEARVLARAVSISFPAEESVVSASITNIPSEQNAILTKLGVGPRSFTAYPNPWGYSSSVANSSAKMQMSQTITASAGNIKPTAVIEYTYNGDAAVGLDFGGAPGGSIPAGLYVQHRQTGTNVANNAFTHSLMGYALNDAAGDNDVIGVSGRARKNNVVNGIGDAAGAWGSAYQYSSQLGLVMGLEGSIYQNVSGSNPRDRLDGGSFAASCALHLGSYSTGSPATAMIAIDGAQFGAWNAIMIDGNSFPGDGISGTVGYNDASWSISNNYPEIGWKVGLATWHIWRGDAAFTVNANQISLQNTATNGGAGHRVRANGIGNAYIDLMTSNTFRAQWFWDGVNSKVVFGSVGTYDVDFRTDETVRMTITAVGNILAPALTSKNYANDAAAAAGGVPLNGFYHTSGTLKIRLA